MVSLHMVQSPWLGVKEGSNFPSSSHKRFNAHTIAPLTILKCISLVVIVLGLEGTVYIHITIKWMLISFSSGI